jgi:hypothetical protein
MKKLLLLSVLLIFAFSYGQGNFKITSNDELVWEKILNENIEIDSQTISLKSTSKSVVYLRNNLSAELIVQHKGERTRLYVKNIKRRTFDIDAEEDVEDIVINKKGVFRKFFISRGHYKFLEQSINNAINSLIEENNYNW